MRRLAPLVLLLVAACQAPAQATPSPTVTPAVTIAPTATPVPSPTPLAALPGLTGEDLTGNLEGFDCSTSTEGVTVYSCERIEADGYLSAGAYGTAADSIQSVTAEAQGSKSKEFLGYIATLPYDGAQPDEARRWVVDNFGGQADTTFGQVNFSLSTEDGTSTLTISTP